MESQDDFKSLQEGIQKSLVSTIKTVNRIASQDLGFQRIAHPEVSELLDESSARILQLSTRLLKSAANVLGAKAPVLEEADDVEVYWPQITDVVDNILHKADTAIDEYTGLIKRKEPPTGESGSNSKRQKSTAPVIRNANVLKPQLEFERKADNNPKGPWKPILSKKPNATIPLKHSLVTFTGDYGLQYKNPYEAEIKEMKYPYRLFQTAEPVPYQPEEGTKATWVDTYEGVLDMLEHLKKAKEIAVDLEAHDFRTYTGIVCLMQVSTREKDWIVDTLKPWRHKLEVLNEVFTDPSIVKVFHGAYMDIIWLQRDLGLYVNGLFDTFFASSELNYPRKGLAYLLQRFVNFEADKQYQLADWRMRPLTKEMLYYARSDTHYLLYIYDNVRNELIAASDTSNPETNHIQRTLERSRELAMSRNEHSDYNVETGLGARGWFNYVLKHAHLSFDSEQFAVFQAVWNWRDQLARDADESVNFVMGSNSVCELARVNPPDIKALHSMLPRSSPLAKSHLNELWNAIQEQKARNGPTLYQFLMEHGPQPSYTNGSIRAKPPVSSTMPPMDGEVSVGRLSTSQLFRNMPISSRWEPQKDSAPMDDNFPFPWQKFIEQVTTALIDEPEVEVVEAEVPVETAAPKEPEEELDEEFTLRQNTKRKAPLSEKSSSSRSSEEDSNEAESDSDEEMEDADDSLLVDDEDEPEPSVGKRSKKNGKGPATSLSKQEVRAQQKAQKKEAKRLEAEEEERKHEEKRLRKQEKKKAKAAEKQDATTEPGFHAVPFDYSTAATVMHAGRNQPKVPQDGAKKRKKERKEAFDPYAKTGDDGLKGARRAPPIKGERSATFKK